jgi:hypothetical protein
MNVRKKRGRPPFIWHGPIGRKFLEAVRDDQYVVLPSGLLGARKTRAAAIRSVLKQTEFALLREKYANPSTRRYLEKMYLDCAEFWAELPTYRAVMGKGLPIYWNRK